MGAEGNLIKTPYYIIIVHGFRPESENFDLRKKGYYRKEHLKGSRMAQISAS